MSNRAIEVIKKVDHFSTDEFPKVEKNNKSILEYLSADLLIELGIVRKLHDKVIYPSSLQRGWVRFKNVDDDNRHNSINRLSDAGDIFPEGDPVKFWFLLQSRPKIGGIGIYFDTKIIPNKQPGPMFHMDLRPNRLIWGRVEGEYLYPQYYKKDRKLFFDALSKY